MKTILGLAVGGMVMYVLMFPWRDGESKETSNACTHTVKARA